VQLVRFVRLGAIGAVGAVCEVGAVGESGEQQADRRIGWHMELIEILSFGFLCASCDICVR
jgi:hypothetical protein